jgi:hypothetical protein
VRALLVLVCAVSLAACGVLDDEGPAVSRAPDPAVYGPAKAAAGVTPPVPVPKLVPPAAEVAKALDGGSIGVVDPGGVVSIEPSALETASDAGLSGLHWSSWGEEGAVGSGSFRVLTCQPTCAGGGSDLVPAQIVLSGVKTCGERRYFERGEVKIAAADAPPGGRQPATYLRAPC